MSTSVAIGWDIPRVMEEMPYGMYIVGTADGQGAPNGMMADWVMQISFKPRLVAVSIENDAHSLANIRSNGRFTVNLLPQDEAGWKLAARFAQPYDGSKVGQRHDAEHPYHLKLEGIGYGVVDGGAPILVDALSWLECQAHEFFSLGDHTLVIGEVLNGAVLHEGDPLTSTYTGWNYSG